MRHTPPDLQVGDACWLLHSILIYEVSIAEVRVTLEGDPHEFKMYRVNPNHATFDYLRGQSFVRNDLFLRPAERKQLIQECQDHIDSLEYIVKELEEEE